MIFCQPLTILTYTPDLTSPTNLTLSDLTVSLNFSPDIQLSKSSQIILGGAYFSAISG